MHTIHSFGMPLYSLSSDTPSLTHSLTHSLVHCSHVLCSITGEEGVIAIRALLDTRGCWLNLHRLVYIDMEDVDDRAAVFDHFKRNTDAMAIPRTKDSVFAQGTNAVDVKILSDIDDTLKCSGGGAAGVDQRFPSGTIYPGILQFYYELDAATEHEPDDPTVPPHCATVEQLDMNALRPALAVQQAMSHFTNEHAFIESLKNQGNLTFLSARPSIDFLPGVAESFTYKEMKELVGTQVCRPQASD
jgi:hypothetical protein